MRIVTKYLFAILSTFLLLVSCGVDEVIASEPVMENLGYGAEASKPARQTIKVLFIGNSFTEDACSYIPSLLSDVVPSEKFVIGIAFISGSPLAQHYANVKDEKVQVGKDEFEPKKYVLNISRNNSLKWSRKYNMSINQVLDYDDWDIVTFQQGGVHSVRDYNTYYEPYILELKNYVKERVGDDVKIGWLSVHGSYHINDAGLYYNWLRTTENSKKVMEQADLDILFPYGTAVQNLRNCSKVKNESDSNGWTVDDGHLQEGLGCLTAAYANTLVLLNEINYTGDVNFMFTPDYVNIKQLNIPGVHLGEKGVVGITPSNCRVALDAAKGAVLNPYYITMLENMSGVEPVYGD